MNTTCSCGRGTVACTAKPGAWFQGEVLTESVSYCIHCHNDNAAAYAAWSKAQPKTPRQPRTVDMNREWNQLVGFLGTDRKAARRSAS